MQTIADSTALPVSLPQAAPSDLQIVLDAWTAATDRLQRTHEALQTEVRRLTDELEVKNRELARRNRLADLGQMAAHIAHEVRNGLVPLKLYSGLLHRKLSQDAASLDIVEKVQMGLIGLETTVNDLLHFSADREPKSESFAVAPLLLEICDSLMPQLQAHEIGVAVHGDPHGVVEADREMLKRAILNLVLNAIDAMPDGGQLTLTAASAADAFEIEIVDSGPGIAESACDRLFEPFFTTKGQGTGLGLAIVDRIAEAHGGQISASNRPTGGAAFLLRLPPNSQIHTKKAA